MLATFSVAMVDTMLDHIYAMIEEFQQYHHQHEVHLVGCLRLAIIYGWVGIWLGKHITSECKHYII